MLGSCLLLLAWSATALVLPDAAYATRGRQSRAGVRLSVPDETKEKILDALKYNKALTEDGEALLQTLVESETLPAAGDDWWSGKFVLRSCNTLGRALRAKGGPLLDGSPVTINIVDGELEIETDILVLGCATGLRIFGSVAADGDRLQLSLKNPEFFEPNEEFGITKALEKCESQLRPQLPSHESPLTSTLEVLFGDEDMLCVKASVDGDDDVMLVLSKDEAAFDVAKRLRG